mmetsp:Transcript_25370/g.78324  ORF Transcript_25370/g.78324 Transcript_25370/m.78324 type:complete len:248 (+) Transcript_25370:898-1641(+)
MYSCDTMAATVDARISRAAWSEAMKCRERSETTLCGSSSGVRRSDADRPSAAVKSAARTTIRSTWRPSVFENCMPRSPRVSSPRTARSKKRSCGRVGSTYALCPHACGTVSAHGVLPRVVMSVASCRKRRYIPIVAPSHVRHAGDTPSRSRSGVNRPSVSKACVPPRGIGATVRKVGLGCFGRASSMSSSISAAVRGRCALSSKNPSSAFWQSTSVVSRSMGSSFAHSCGLSVGVASPTGKRSRCSS